MYVPCFVAVVCVVASFGEERAGCSTLSVTPNIN